MIGNALPSGQALSMSLRTSPTTRSTAWLVAINKVILPQLATDTPLLPGDEPQASRGALQALRRNIGSRVRSRTGKPLALLLPRPWHRPRQFLQLHPLRLPPLQDRLL